jgi:hypothetical protein
MQIKEADNQSKEEELHPALCSKKDDGEDKKMKRILTTEAQREFMARAARFDPRVL